MTSQNDPAGHIAASPRRQQPVDSLRRCYYATDPTARRPWCTLTATVRYGAVALCPSCNAARSTLGKGQTPVPLPAGPGFDVLGWVASAHQQAGAAEATLAAAVTRARQGGATWSVIGAQLGVSRQGAQQRFTSSLAASKRPPPTTRPLLQPAHPTGSALTSKTMGCLTWHLRQTWAPLTFTDENRPEPIDPVAPAQRSQGADHKAATKTTTEDLPARSFTTLLGHLGTLTRNHLRVAGHDQSGFDLLAIPTPTQRQAFELLGAPIPLTLK